MQSTMTCEQVREGLREYLDAAADASAGEVALRHLRDCAACGSYATQLKETSTLLSRLARAPMPAAIKARLLAEFRRTAR